MEIAINKIILFLIIIFPGIIFLRFYYTGEFTKQFSKRPLTETFYLSIIPGIIIQGITILTFNGFYDAEGLQTYINRVNILLNNEFVVSNLNNKLLLFIGIYFALLGVYAIIFASIFHWIIRFFNVDKASPVLRFDNSWHYYFSGEITKFKDFKGAISRSHKVLMTEADVLILSNDKTKLYKGIIRQHTICKNTGRLQEIYMTDTRRYSESIAGYKEIPGNIFIIPYEKIININLKFVTTPTRIRHRMAEVVNAVLNILGLVLLILLFIDIFGIFKNLSIWSHIVVRILVFLDWIIFVTLISLFIPKPANAKSKSNKTDPWVYVYLLVFLVLFTYIIYRYSL